MNASDKRTIAQVQTMELAWRAGLRSRQPRLVSRKMEGVTLDTHAQARRAASALRVRVGWLLTRSWWFSAAMRLWLVPSMSNPNCGGELGAGPLCTLWDILLV